MKESSPAESPAIEEKNGSSTGRRASTSHDTAVNNDSGLSDIGLFSRLIAWVALSFLRLLKFLSRLISPQRLTDLCSGLGRACSYFCPREMKIMRCQLYYAHRRLTDSESTLVENNSSSGQTVSPLFSPDGTPHELPRKVFAHVGRAVGELLLVDEYFPPSAPGTSIRPDCKYPFVVTSEGEEIARQYVAQGKGGVGLSAHIGCFELLAAYLVHRGFPITVIGRKPRYPWLAQVVDRLRNSYGVQTVWRSDRAMIKVLLRSLREGRFLAVLLDQDTALESLYSPFFELPAACPVAPVRLAVQMKLPVVTSFIVRTGALSQHVITEDVPYDRNDPQAAQFILDTYHQRVAQLILKYPDQWIWWHRRWRRRPGVDYASGQPGLLRTTEQYLAWLEEMPRA